MFLSKRKRSLDEKTPFSDFIDYHDGGPERDRTVDLSDANRTLSQLSYRPKHIARTRQRQ